MPGLLWVLAGNVQVKKIVERPTFMNFLVLHVLFIAN